MYRFQPTLKRLPVPALEQTVRDAVAFAGVFASAEDKALLEKQAQRFMDGAAAKLQERLLRYAAAVPTGNWLEPTWDGGYLGWRGPLPVHMNYFLEADLAGAGRLAALSQADVAYEACIASLEHFGRVRREELEPDSDRQGPMCMAQHARVSGHARIPKAGSDEAVCYDTPPLGLQAEGAGGLHFATRYEPVRGTRTVAVLRAGHVFVVPLTLEDGETPHPALRDALSRIAAGISGAGGAGAGSTAGLAGLPLLTALPREDWAQARQALVAHPDGRRLIDGIDRSQFVLCLDEGACVDESALLRGYILGGDPASTGAAGGASLDGAAAAARWFDKHCVVVGRVADDAASAAGPASGGADAGGSHRVGFLFEHMPGDGLTTLRWVEAVRTALADGTAAASGSAGDAASVLGDALSHPNSVALPAEAAALVSDAVSRGRAEIANWYRDMSGFALRLEGSGSTAFKEAGLPPDAGFQFAMQAGTLRATGSLRATYESCSTARFLHGRTEVIRGASPEAAAAARAFDGLSDSASLESKQAVWQAVQAATTAHRNFSARCQDGQGIDRHLTGLGLALDLLATPEPQRDEGPSASLDPAEREAATAFLRSPLLTSAATWRLSTSNCGSQQTAYFGFGPVAEAGAGVGYFIRKQDLRATVTSFADPAAPGVDAADIATAFSDAVAKLLALGRDVNGRA
ncbi:hypothetical protein FNF28_04272 [Cafeteria roenbergensis]|uniref:Choline/carnitine acyltransferase domain-containing protein n=1 Tax=Cafeteria roenbergensis TaxID=33653 RepID=A0A5A8DCP8_CAFRO|nr:hypothetical protein FNF28_04272 [Cafeteria roenbergensis]